MKYLSFFLLFSIAVPLQAQTNFFGKIRLDEEKSITNLLVADVKNLEGYRVQIFTGNASDRQKAEEIKEYVETELQIKTYVEYEAPLVKVRVGNFIDKLEAVAIRERLKKKFSNAYLVKVKQIEIPEIKEVNEEEKIQQEELEIFD